MSKIKNKEKRKYNFVDLIPTLNKMSRYQFLFILLEGTNHEQPSRNNQYTCCPLPSV